MDEITKALNEGIESVKGHLATQVKETEARLETMISKASEEAKLNGKTNEETLNSVKSLEANYIALKERQDAYEKSNARLGANGREKAFGESLKESLQANADRLQAFKSNRTPVSMEIKGVMSQADNLSGEVIEPTRVAGVKYDPERTVRVRQFLPQGTTDSNAIAYVKETEYTDGTNVTREIYTKEESEFTLTRETANVVKIATHFRVSEEMLNDISYLASHISLRGVEKYRNKEDQQLLYGTGLNGQIEGLTVSSSPYALGYVDPFAQEIDILRTSFKQLRNGNYNPTGAMVSINRYFDMLGRKDADGRYILPDGVVLDNGILRLLGVPIIPTNALATNDFLVADFPMMTTLFDREGVNVRFYDQDQDNAVRNLVTVVIEGRVALPTYLPNAGRYGNFATAISNAGNS
jgi:HK97 family phage major capsid protein